MFVICYILFQEKENTSICFLADWMIHLSAVAKRHLKASRRTLTGSILKPPHQQKSITRSGCCVSVASMRCGWKRTSALQCHDFLYVSCGLTVSWFSMCFLWPMLQGLSYSLGLESLSQCFQSRAVEHEFAIFSPEELEICLSSERRALLARRSPSAKFQAYQLLSPVPKPKHRSKYIAQMSTWFITVSLWIAKEIAEVASSSCLVIVRNGIENCQLHYLLNKISFGWCSHVLPPYTNSSVLSPYQTSFMLVAASCCRWCVDLAAPTTSSKDGWWIWSMPWLPASRKVDRIPLRHGCMVRMMGEWCQWVEFGSRRVTVSLILHLQKLLGNKLV